MLVTKYTSYLRNSTLCLNINFKVYLLAQIWLGEEEVNKEFNFLTNERFVVCVCVYVSVLVCVCVCVRGRCRWC